MSDARFTDTRAYIEGEIRRLMPILGDGKQGNDKFIKQKLIALIEALDGLNACGDDIDAYGDYVSRLYRANAGAADGLHGILEHMGVRHHHAGRQYPERDD